MRLNSPRTLPSRRVRNALESSRLKVEAVDECINETDRVVRSHVVVHSIGQKQKLGTLFTGDMCHDTFLANRHGEPEASSPTPARLSPPFHTVWTGFTTIWKRI